MAASKDFVVQKGLDLNGTLTYRSAGVQLGSIFNDSSAVNIQANSNAPGGLKLGTSGAFPLIGYTNGAERFRVDSSGDFVLQNGLGLAWGDKTTYIGGNASTDFINFVTNGVERMRISSVGAIGIGVTPNNWSQGTGFQFGPSAVGFLFNDSNNTNIGSNAYFDTTWKYQVSSVGASRYAQTSGGHLWYTAPAGTAGSAVTFTPRMIIDVNGNVGVGQTPTTFNKFSTASSVGITSNGTKGTMGEVFANPLIAGFRANSYYDTGTAQIKATSTGYSPEIQLRTDNGAIVFNRSTSASSDSVIAQSESLRIDASGSVGIGTSTPGYGATPGGSSGNGRTYLTVVGSSANSAAVIQLAANGGGQTPNGVLEFIDIGNTASSSLRAAFIYSGASGSAANNKGSFLAFATKADGVSGAGQVNMTLDSNGNLGVGTISPDVRLSVLGSVRVGTGSPTTGYTGIILASTATDTFTTDTDKVIHHYGITAKEFSDAAGAPSVVISGYAGLRFYTNGSESLRLDSNGNVGLGTTPSTWSTGRALELGTAGNALWGYSGNIILSQNTSGYSTNFFYATAAAATRYQQTAGQHQWHIAPSGTAGNAISFTQAMTLETSGNLALGLTSGNLSGYGAGVRVFTVQGNSLPGAIELALNLATGQNNTLGEINFVNNASTVTSKQSAYITGFQDGTSTTAPGGGIRITTRTDGGGLAERLRINNAGNVGINIGSPTYKLEVGASGVFALNDSTNANKGTFQMTAGGLEFYTGSAKYIALGTASTERLRIDAAGNVGIGVVPSTWAGGGVGLQIGVNGSLSSFTSTGTTTPFVALSSNAYSVSTTQQNYIQTAAAASYSQFNGLHRWFSAPSGTAGTAIAFTQLMTLDAGGNLLLTAGGGLGYGTGSGGTVTQATSRTTGVTINKPAGAITLVSAAGTTAWQSFTVTNSTVAATDVVKVCQKSGTDLYMIHVTAVAAGSFRVTFATTGGTTTEQPVFNFVVIKAATA